jgi:hypothetical protein
MRKQDIHKPLVDLHGKTYEEIAAAADRGVSSVHRWLTGQSIPRKQSDINSLAKAIGMKADALLLALYRGRAA